MGVLETTHPTGVTSKIRDPEISKELCKRRNPAVNESPYALSWVFKVRARPTRTLRELKIRITNPSTRLRMSTCPSLPSLTLTLILATLTSLSLAITRPQIALASCGGCCAARSADSEELPHDPCLGRRRSCPIFSSKGKLKKRRKRRPSRRSNRKWMSPPWSCPRRPVPPLLLTLVCWPLLMLSPPPKRRRALLI